MLSHLFSVLSALFVKNYPGWGYLPLFFEDKMKPQTVTPVVLTARCTHHTASGRRCRLSVSDAHSSLCRQHRAEQIQEQSADHHLVLLRNFEDFQTAQGINYSLKHLYELLAQNRISPRRAAVLSHICGLLLRTLPQIDADQAAGITDSDEDAEKHEDSVLDLASDSDAHTETRTETEMEVHPDSASAWDSSLPEPDPRKKPS
jgi:hypothetical protein